MCHLFLFMLRCYLYYVSELRTSIFGFKLKFTNLLSKYHSTKFIAIPHRLTVLCILTFQNSCPFISANFPNNSIKYTFFFFPHSSHPSSLADQQVCMRSYTSTTMQISKPRVVIKSDPSLAADALENLAFLRCDREIWRPVQFSTKSKKSLNAH